MVKQQSKVLKNHTTLKIGSYIGADGVDLWKEEEWKRELERHQVLVMTAAILLQILRHSYIQVRHINLLIFDECHRAVGNHDYAQIMRDYVHHEDVQKRPVIFGMTASIINGKCAPHQIESKIKALESLMLSRIATTKYQDDLEKHSTKPQESTVFYHQIGIDYYVQSVLNVISELSDISKGSGFCNDILAIYDNDLDRISNSIQKDCLSAYEELGLFGLHQIISLSVAQYSRMNNMTAIDMSKALAYYQLFDKLKMMKEMCEKYHFHYCQSVSSHPKLKLLLSNLRKYQMMMADDEDHFCGIIFVEKRCIAMTLSSVLNILADYDQSLSSIKCDFVVGHGTGVNSSQVMTNMTYQQQACSIERFRRREINLLIATNVIEEGIDVPKCNVVIRFNEIKTFSSYMQSKGRARAQLAHFMMMIDEDAKQEKVRQIKQWSKIEDELQKHCHDREPGDEIDDILANQQLNLIPPFKIESTGAKITMSNSISILNWQVCYLCPYSVSVIN